MPLITACTIDSVLHNIRCVWNISTLMSNAANARLSVITVPDCDSRKMIECSTKSSTVIESRWVQG